MFSVSIKSDIPTLSIFASDVQRRQMPFAIMVTINDLAFGSKDNTVTRVWPRAFEARNKSFAKAVYRVEKATKTKLVAKVFDRLGRANLLEHTEGGIKTPQGRHVAIPSHELKRKRSGRGVPKASRPRVLLDKPKVFKTTINGQLVIARRRTKKQFPIEVLYILEDRAVLKRTFPMYREHERYVRREVGPTFAKAFENAMRTAKPRKTAR